MFLGKSSLRPVVAAVFLAALFHLCGTAYAAEETPTVKAQLKLQAIEAFKNVAIKNIRATRVGFAAQVGKKDVYLSMFPIAKKKDEDPDLYNVALSENDIRLSDILPPLEDSAVGDLKVPTVILLYAEADNEVDLGDLNMPGELRRMFHAVLPNGAKGKLKFRKGPNLFTVFHVENSPGLRKLQKDIGLSRHPVTLQGSISNEAIKLLANGKAGGGNRKHLKKVMLKGLDLEAHFPAIEPRGFPDAFKWDDNALVRIQGGKFKFDDAEREGVRVLIGTGAEIDALGEKLRFDVAFDIVRSKDTNVVRLSGKASEFKKISVMGVKPKSLALQGERKDRVWDVGLVGEAELHKKDIGIAVQWEKPPKDLPGGKSGYAIRIHDDLTVSELIGKGDSVPGLNHIRVDDIVIRKRTISAKMMLITKKADAKKDVKRKERGTDVIFFRPAKGAKLHVALSHETFDFNEFIPGAGIFMSEFDLKDMVMLIVPKDAAKKKFPIDDLPDLIAEKVREVVDGDEVDLAVGANMFAMYDMKTSSVTNFIASRFKTNKHVPLRGVVNPRIFRGSHGKGGKGPGLKGKLKALVMKSLNISMPISKLRIPGMPKGLGFHLPKITLRGSDGDKKDKKKSGPSLKLSLEGLMNMKVGSMRLRFPGAFSIGRPSGGGGGRAISFKGLSKGAWPSPAGIPWLHLNNLGLNIELSSGGSGGMGFDIGLKGLTNIGKLKNLDIDIDIKSAGGALKAGMIKIGNKVKLADLPGFKSIPYANRLTLSDLAISTDGISASTLFRGFPAKIGLFNTEGSSGGKRWSMGLSMDAINLGNLMHSKAAKTILGKIHLSKSALFFSEHPIDMSMGNLPDFMKDIFGPILKGFEGRFKLSPGLTLAGLFDPSHKSGHPGGFGKLGLNAPVHLIGSIGGLFGGPPSLSLAGKLPNIPSMPGLPKFLRIPKVVAPAFFVNVVEQDVAVGLESQFHVKVDKDDLVFDGKLEIVLKEDGLAFEIAAVEAKELDPKKWKASGKALGAKLKKGKKSKDEDKTKLEKTRTWHHPFGISGLNLRDLGLKVGVSPDSAVLLGFSGTADIGSEEVHLAAEIESVLAAAGVPKSVAFEGTITHFGFDDIIKLTAAVTGLKAPKEVKNLPFFAIRNARLAFATPGAADPDLGLNEQGFAMKGEFLFMQQELGAVNVVIDETSGLKIKGKIDPLHLGPIQLRKNVLDVSMGVKELPYFRFNSDIELIGMRQRIVADFEVPKVSFRIVDKIGDLATATLDLESVGIDLNNGRIHNPDFIIGGTFKEDFYGWFSKEMVTVSHAVFAELNKTYERDLAVLHGAEKAVHAIDKKVEAARAKVRRERQRAVAKLEQARRKVNYLRSKANHAHHKRKKCHWYSVGCKIKWEARYLAYKAARGVADGVLRAIEKGIEVMPIDLDPRVAGLLAERDIALAGLHAAELAVEGLEEMDKFAEKALDAIARGIGKYKPFEIHKASFLGGLLGVTIHDEPLLLSMDFSVFGKRMKQDFAFKLLDPKYDVKELSLIAYHGLERLFDGAMKKVPHQMKDKVFGIVGKRIAELEKVNRHEMAKHKKEFATLRDRAASLKRKIAKADERRTKALAARKTKMLDVEPASQVFSRKMLEVGHSGHCLSIGSGGQRIEQRKCKDSDGWQRWSAVATKDGYVQIRNSNRCMGVLGASNDLAVQLRLEGCGKKERQQWKVQSHDGDFFRVSNRASQKCLNFINPNAVPGKTKAEWWPCHGADAQVFRVIKTTAPVFHDAKTLISSARSDLCIGTAKFNPMAGKSFSWANPARNYAAQTKCNPKDALQRFSYVEDLRGDLRLINGEGNCLFPLRRHAGSPVMALSCDRASDQFWEKDVTKGGFVLRNVGAKLCLDTFHASLSKGASLILAHCGKERNQIWNFGLPKSNQKWKTVKNARPPRNAFRAGGSKRGKKASGRVYVCRATRKGRRFIGQVDKDGKCLIAAQKGVRKFSSYQILKSVKKGRWVSDIGGDVPFDAVPAGTNGRHMLYVCRALKAGRVVVGSAAPGECRYAEGKKTRIAATFDVLVSQ